MLNQQIFKLLDTNVGNSFEKENNSIFFKSKLITPLEQYILNFNLTLINDNLLSLTISEELNVLCEEIFKLKKDENNHLVLTNSYLDEFKIQTNKSINELLITDEILFNLVHLSLKNNNIEHLALNLFIKEMLDFIHFKNDGQKELSFEELFILGGIETYKILISNNESNKIVNIDKLTNINNKNVIATDRELSNLDIISDIIHDSNASNIDNKLLNVDLSYDFIHLISYYED